MGEAGARGEAEERSSGLRGYLVEGQRGRGGEPPGSEGHVASPAQPWAAENQPTNQPTDRQNGAYSRR